MPRVGLIDSSTRNFKGQGEIVLLLGFTSRTLSLMIPSPSLSNALKAPVGEEHTGQRPVTGSPPLHCCNFSSEDRGRSAVLQHKNVPGRVSTITLSLPAHSELTAGLYLCSAWIESTGTRSGPRARKGGPPLTEHALQPDEAADEAVEVDVHVLVCIAHGNDVVELAVEVESCGGQHGGAGSSLSSLYCVLFSASQPSCVTQKHSFVCPPPSDLSLHQPSSGCPPPTVFPSTCVIDCISHLVAVDGTRLVCVIVFENSLAIENLQTGVTQ